MAQFKVTVAYASPVKQSLISVAVEEGATLETVIDRSGILEMFPEINLMQQKVGVFGQIKLLTERVKEGDRIEIYRGLVIDPKEARKKRGKKS